MPRLGSNFFDSYNGQIDRLRKRRGENVEAFNSFVKLRTELGETATVDDMEKYKAQLSGGDSYFMSALPTSTMIEETQKRLVQNQADKIQTERQNQIKTSDDELALTEKIVSGLVNVDISTPEGQRKLGEAFSTAGKPKLGQQYADLIPNMHENAKLSATKDFATSIGFDQFNTEESTQNALTQAPAWMQSLLKIRGDNNVKTANNTKIKDAKESTTAQFAEMINDAGGDIVNMRKAVKADLKLKLGPLYNDQILDELMVAAEGQMGMDTSRRRVEAMSQVTATPEQLLAASTDPAQLRVLARNSLIASGFPNPSEDDIDQAVETLKGQLTTARTDDYNKRVSLAVTEAQALTTRMLEQIDGDEEIDEQVDTILKGQFGEEAYNNLSESQKATAQARVRAIVANNSRLANDADVEEGVEAVNSAILVDPELKRISEMGPSKDKIQSIYNRINTMRASKGLTRLTDEVMKEKYGKQVQALFNVGASTRYEKEIKTATENATANVEAITTGHKKMMENISGPLPDEWTVVSEILSINYIPRSAAGYAAYQSAILGLSKKSPPATPEEAYAMATTIANSLGWLPAANAKQVLIAEELASKDLIMPDTPIGEFLNSEKALLSADMEGVLSTIKLMPIDSTQASQQTKDAALEALDEWENGLIVDMNSTSIQPLLQGLDGSTHVEHNNTVRDMADAMRAKIIQSKSEGQYSFMTHSSGPNGGFFLIASKEDRELVEANGFEVGASYRKLPDGTYEKVLNPVIESPDGSGTRDRTLQEVDPASSPFSQDVQSIIRNSDLQSATANVASAISSNGFQDLPASAPMFRSGVYQYFFGSSTPDAQAKLDLSRRLADFLKTPQANSYMQNNPDTYSSLFQDPLAWAANAGFQP